jgi:medium-chain acyl-[acyl-carrier-protein] hydrolase
MSEVPSIYKEQRTIESFDVDVKGRLRPAVLFSFLTNVAWKHSALTDHGYQGLSARNQLWVLSKFALSIARIPRWGDQVAIESWWKGNEKLYAKRDFVVVSPEGERFASATTAWLVLDGETRRPIRMSEMVFPWKPGRSEMETNLKKVEQLAAGETRARFRAAFSDIDVNGHVTAMRYLQWIMDSHPLDTLETAQPRTLDVSFLGEGAVNDELEVKAEQRDGFELCSVVRTSDTKELCRARLEWAAG